MATKLARYVTLKEVARLMGWGTSKTSLQHLRRRLTAKQELLGQSFLVKLGPAEHSPWVTTLPLLRQHCPELFDKPAEALDMLAEAAASLRQEIALLRRQNQDLRARIRQLEHDLKALQDASRAA